MPRRSRPLTPWYYSIDLSFLLPWSIHHFGSKDSAWAGAEGAPENISPSANLATGPGGRPLSLHDRIQEDFPGTPSSTLEATIAANNSQSNAGPRPPTGRVQSTISFIAVICSLLMRFPWPVWFSRRWSARERSPTSCCPSRLHAPRGLLPRCRVSRRPHGWTQRGSSGCLCSVSFQCSHSLWLIERRYEAWLRRGVRCCCRRCRCWWCPFWRPQWSLLPRAPHAWCLPSPWCLHVQRCSGAVYVPCPPLTRDHEHAESWFWIRLGGPCRSFRHFHVLEQPR